MSDLIDDGDSLVPTPLDTERLVILPIDGRMQNERGTWVVLRYPPKPKSPKWCEWSLIVNCSGLKSRSAPYEFKNVQALITFLGQLEKERKKDE
jgi:hypothetical protein